MRRLLRIVHLLIGHPGRSVERITLGFRCTACGAEWGRWDYP